MIGCSLRTSTACYQVFFIDSMEMKTVKEGFEGKQCCSFTNVCKEFPLSMRGSMGEKRWCLYNTRQGSFFPIPRSRKHILNKNGPRNSTSSFHPACYFYFPHNQFLTCFFPILQFECIYTKCINVY